LVLGIHPKPPSQSCIVVACMEIMPSCQLIIGLALEKIQGFLLPRTDIISCRQPVGIIIRLLDNIALQGRYAKVIEEGFSPFFALVAQVNIEISRLFRYDLLV
jgi:hypothetical protein